MTQKIEGEGSDDGEKKEKEEKIWGRKWLRPSSTDTSKLLNTVMIEKKLMST